MSTFLKTGKARNLQLPRLVTCKTRNLEGLCPEGGRLLLFRKVLLVLMLKGFLRESLPESFGSIKGETLGFVPAGRRGALGATRTRLVGKF